MSSLTTLTSRYALKVPLVLAPMLGASNGTLAGAVSKAGGLGFVAWTPGPAASLASELGIARSTAGPSPSLGVGVQCWQLSARGQDGTEAMDVIARATDIQALWLFAGDWKHWVDALRRTEVALGGRKKDIWLQIGSVDEATDALDSKLVDVLVVQGSEAGGHGLIKSTPLATLLAKVVSLAAASPKPIPVVAAGGLMTGSDLARVISQGAAAGVMGTRFLTTHEAAFSDAKKRAVCEARVGGGSETAKEEVTMRSVAWDRLSGAKWPEGYDGRALVNRSPSEYTAAAHSEDAVAELKKTYALAVAQSDLSLASVFAGVGAGKVDKIQGAEEVVREIQKGWEAATRAD